MAVIGIYTKDFPNLGRAVLNTDIIPITELGNVVTYKTTIADLMNSRITGSEGQLSKFGAGNTLTNSILKEIGNAIHLTHAGASFASFGIVNPGTPGDPGVDNDAYIGSTINNDFLIRVNNVEAARFDTNLRLKIANIQNATVDTDKFLVSDGGIVKYRTASELLSDIGAQGSITLTTTGTSGAATLIGNTLNIPNYSTDLSGYVTLGTAQTITGTKTFSGTVTANSFVKSGGTANQVLRADGTVTEDLISFGEVYAKFVQLSLPFTSGFIPKITGDSPSNYFIGNSQIQDNGTNVSIGYTTNPGLYKLDVDGTMRVAGAATFSNNLEAGAIGGAVTKGDLLVDATSLSATVYVGRLSSTSNDNTSFVVRNRVGVESFKIVGNTGAATFSSSVTAANLYSTGASNFATSGGNVGIGTASPTIFASSYKTLAINGSAASVLEFKIGDVSSAYIISDGNSSSFTELGNKFLTFGTNNTERMRITSGGNVIIGPGTVSGAHLLQVNGSVLATAYFESSSISWKNILTTNPTTELNLDVIKYTRKSDENKDVRYGYSAEQVHALMPELTDKDVASVKYLDVHTVLIAQLQQEIKELKAKLN